MQTISESAIAPSELLALEVSGMKCAGCVSAVEKQLMQQPGVISATVNLVTEVALVECEPGQANSTALASVLTEAGFPSRLRNDNTEQEDLETPSPAQKSEQPYLHQLAIAAALLILSTIGHLKHVGFEIPILSSIGFHWGLATLTLLVPGRGILLDGWRGLRHNTPTMNTLVALGAITAYSTSVVALLFPQLGWECFFDEPVMLLGFILLGRTLEQQARGKALTAFRSLLALKPSLARVIKAPKGLKHAEAFTHYPSIELPADQVKVGEWLQVLPGDKIPVDGEVVAGQTTINEAMITGESTAVLKQPGDRVVAGSLNQSGAIAIRAIRTGKNTTLAQIIALVEAAQTRKAPIQRLADTVAGYFTYGVMAIAALTFVFWYIVGFPLWGDALQQVMMGHTASHMGHLMTPVAPRLLLSLKLAIAVLVVACPCALGLATPTAILVGTGIGAERGLLIRGGDVLENVHRLQTLVFDKTGTLTTGHPTVTDIVSFDPSFSTNTLLQLAATVESGTRHPLANAIRAEADRQNLPLLSVTDFQTSPGYGVSAVVDGQTVLLGAPDWLRQHGVEVDANSAMDPLIAAGKSLVYVAADGICVGAIAAIDALRPDAATTVSQLKQMGLRVMMMTGDQAAVAQAIAQSLGLTNDEVMAGVHPAAKAAAIAAHQAEGACVGMVGDGINDAPALAQADISISLHSATDVAVETADIILMRDRLSDVVEALHLSRATFAKIQQNLFWAFAYNSIGIPIAAGVLLPQMGMLLSPSLAGALMAFSSVSVVTNALLLRRTFPSLASN